MRTLATRSALASVVFLTLLAGCDGGGGGDTTATTPPAAPATPTGVTAVPGNARVTISWPAVAGATSYDLYVSESAGVTKASGTKISGVTSPYVHTGRTNNTTYHYVLTASNSHGESGESAEVSATPRYPASTPETISAVGGQSQVTVSWSASPGATSYNLYWSTTSGVMPAYGAKIAGVTSPYVHSGRSNGTTYYYVVTALNGEVESPASIQASATAGVPGSPGAPTGLTASAGNTAVTLDWTAVPGVTSYNVYWSTRPGVTTATGTKITGATRPYVHTGRLNGTSYHYVLTAQNGLGESGPSGEATATPSFPGHVISGTVTYAGSKTGRIYLVASCGSGCGPGPEYGTSLDAPGSFTIRGARPGVYSVYAFKDVLGYGALRNDTSPWGASPGFVVSGDVSGVGVELREDWYTPPPVAPAFEAIATGDGAVLLLWAKVMDGGRWERVTGYDIAWGLDPANVASGTRQLAAHDDGSWLVGLPNGEGYWFKIASRVGDTVSPWSAPLGPVTVGPQVAGYTVSGTVTLPTAATGPLYVLLLDISTFDFRVARIESPVASQPYTISGVPGGAHVLYALLDQDGSGTLSLGDLDTEGEARLAVLGDTSGADLALPAPAGARGRMKTTRTIGADGHDDYTISAYLDDGSKRAVAATLVTARGITTPVDLARSRTGFETSMTPPLNVLPSPGESYVFSVTYADGTSGTVTVPLEVLGPPGNMTAGGSNRAVPTFSWTSPSPAPSRPVAYTVSVTGMDTWWDYPLRDAGVPNLTSVVYDADGFAFSPTLSTGLPYDWTVTVRDRAGNSTNATARYTP